MQQLHWKKGCCHFSTTDSQLKGTKQSCLGMILIIAVGSFILQKLHGVLVIRTVRCWGNTVYNLSGKPPIFRISERLQILVTFAAKVLTVLKNKIVLFCTVSGTLCPQTFRVHSKQIYSQFLGEQGPRDTNFWWWYQKSQRHDIQKAVYSYL